MQSGRFLIVLAEVELLNTLMCRTCVVDVKQVVQRPVTLIFQQNFTQPRGLGTQLFSNPGKMVMTRTFPERARDVRCIHSAALPGLRAYRVLSVLAL